MTAADDEKRRTRLPTPNGDAPLVNEHEATAAPALRGVDAVSRAAALHARLVESVRDYAIFALDPQGYVLTWNPGAQRFKGYLAGEIIGRHFSTFYPPEDIAAGKPARELEVAAEVGRFEDEGWRVRKDGSVFWANVIITALRDEAGGLIGFGKVTRDLSDRRSTEEALRQSEERFRLLVDGVREYAIYMLDLDGRVGSWNPGAESMKGYQAREIIGRHFSAFYLAEDVVAGKPKRALELASASGSYQTEEWRVRKDGTRFWASVVISALYDPHGFPLGYVKVTRDLTERRASEERALADTRRIAEAESASRTKSEFLMLMSHELRTPINATIGYAELIQMGIGGPVTTQQLEYLSRIRSSQQHLLGIINDLLDFGRIEAGQQTYELASVSLRSMVDAVVPMVEPQSTSKGIALDAPRCEEDLRGLADRPKAEQIILNLLSNAVKFTPSGGRVTIACGSDESGVRISVTDTGPGIPSGEEEAIFAPFVQLGRSLSSPHEGTGLGLAISRDLARGMGGELTLESRYGHGATFTLRLRPA